MLLRFLLKRKEEFDIIKNCIGKALKHFLNNSLPKDLSRSVIDSLFHEERFTFPYTYFGVVSHFMHLGTNKFAVDFFGGNLVAEVVLKSLVDYSEGR